MDIYNVQNEPKSNQSRRNILVMKKTISIFIAILVKFLFLIIYVFRKSKDKISFVISLISLYNISSIANLFIYTFMGVKFRREQNI